MSTTEKTYASKRIAIIVGLLFITATAASILGSLIILDPILTAPDYLLTVAENDTQLITGVLLELTNSIAVVIIAFLLFPILNKFGKALALGYVAFRIIESVVLIIGSVSLLALLTLSREYGLAEAADASYFQALGSLLIAVHEWTDMLGAMIFFGITALILNYLFYKSNLVPRFISVWGFLGAILILAAGLLGLYGLGYLSPISVLLALPLALNEMVLAVWLIVKGFNLAAGDSGPA
jgi:hypothetical protein